MEVVIKRWNTGKQCCLSDQTTRHRGEKQSSIILRTPGNTMVLCQLKGFQSEALELLKTRTYQAFFKNPNTHFLLFFRLVHRESVSNST